MMGGTLQGRDVPDSGRLVQMNIITISETGLIAFFRSRSGRPAEIQFTAPSARDRRADASSKA